MRYRVELAERPDGLYAVWQGRVFAAQRSTADASVLLVAAPGEDAPADFDTGFESRPAKVVPESEVAATFSLQTHCLFDDDTYRIAPGEGLTLRWNGTDEVRARQLGLRDFGVTATEDEITAIWQERHDFTVGARTLGVGDPQEMVRDIARLLRTVVPNGWERIAAQFRQVGDYAEIEVRAAGEGESVSLPASPRLGQLFSELRAAMYQPGAGTWFKGTLTLVAPADFAFDHDAEAEPNWRQSPAGRPTARAYEAELEQFPREREQVPDWLAAKAGLPVDATFRHAAVVDAQNPGEPPVVNRQALPPEEARALFDYLYRAPVAVSRPYRLPDLFAPVNPPEVPDAFHTDGEWIWAAAVPHYLRKYGLPPQPELAGHIRAHGYRVPHVPPHLLAAAEAELRGEPLPPQPAAGEVDAVTLTDRGGDPPYGLRASEVLTVLERRLAEYGIAARSYRIGSRAEGAWSLRRTESSWEVTGPDGAEPAAFARVEEAARFLLGSLLLYPVRVVDDEGSWPIQPMRGEPPLTMFRAKRLITLAAGTTLVRFGAETGNLLHEETARFPETSLVPDREGQQALYRVARPLRVLTGVTEPWGALPGGAVAYFLPYATGQHVEIGALERI
ncbi:TNT domain-containing protein [Amycolatopsis endophytica]|uniref:TNT domain-containing protein n=1 Tax=Amycolatopsis endophytica TaxID=860233 RepID=UPI0015CCC00D|nr:TNT domain-containing protein [Amycolatopsis endophytica]